MSRPTAVHYLLLCCAIALLPLTPASAGETCGGPGTCIDGAYCDSLRCYAPDSTVSQLFCSCQLLDPDCGLGECVGNSYCEPAGCGNPQCYFADSFLSLALCSGIPLDENCNLTSVEGCTAPPPEMHVWWTFDETSGSTAADIIGNHDGTHVNGPLPWPGMVAGALLFDGIDDHVKAPQLAQHRYDQLTLDAWIKIDRVEADAFYPIVSFGSGTYVLGVSGDELVFATQPSPSSFAYFTNAANLQEQVWIHVAVTADPASEQVVFYVNGQAVQTYSTYQVNPSYGGPNDVWNVGTNGYQSHFFDGMIDEVEIFERPLGSGEIRKIFEAGPSGKCKPR